MRTLNLLISGALCLTLFSCDALLGEHCPEEDYGINNCGLAPDAGDCEAKFTKYYYDQSTGKCTAFDWGGCGGTVPFHTLEECKECSGESTSNEHSEGAFGGLFN
ncbi:MAG: BPTI/Kunitz domain-containing protein [Salibacteraceae bacterium]